jgi:hypothetical protein
MWLEIGCTHRDEFLIYIVPRGMSSAMQQEIGILCHSQDGYSRLDAVLLRVEWKGTHRTSPLHKYF